ncbi:hypothetical protein BH09PLA1_BH09PLA1_26680 [soil metagenome]
MTRPLGRSLPARTARGGREKLAATARVPSMAKILIERLRIIILWFYRHFTFAS